MLADDNNPDVSEDIRQFMKKKNQYILMFNSMQHGNVQ